MKNELLENYQEVIAKIYVAALRSLNRKVGREIFISMLKGRKDSKIIKGKFKLTIRDGSFWPKKLKYVMALTSSFYTFSVLDLSQMVNKS